MKKNCIFLGAILLFLVACSSDKTTTDNENLPDEQTPTDTDVATDDNTIPTDDAAMADDVVTDEVATDDVATDDVATDDVATDDLLTDGSDEISSDDDALLVGVTGTITVKVGEDETPVDLSTLDTVDFEGNTAVRVMRIVEMAAIELPYNYHYNFIAGDGFNVLVDKLEGDYSKLPWYEELELGFVYYDTVKETLRVGWDDSLGFPGSLGVKGIDGGTIEAVEIGLTNFVVIAGTTRALLDTGDLPTVDVVDYKHPEDGAKPMIPMADIFTAAVVETPETLVYKFFGNDGFSNNDDNLMPYQNTTHGYYEPEKRRIIMEEAWDTLECCWSVKDTVLILGIAQ